MLHQFNIVIHTRQNAEYKYHKTEHVAEYFHLVKVRNHTVFSNNKNTMDQLGMLIAR